MADFRVKEPHEGKVGERIYKKRHEMEYRRFYFLDPLALGGEFLTINRTGRLNKGRNWQKFFEAPVDNSNGPAFRNWLNAVRTLAPREVHLYTVDRPSADRRVRPASWPRLLEIEKEVRESTQASTFVFSCQAHSSWDRGE